jgi:hypothetical protein
LYIRPGLSSDNQEDRARHDYHWSSVGLITDYIVATLISNDNKATGMSGSLVKMDKGIIPSNTSLFAS